MTPGDLARRLAALDLGAVAAAALSQMAATIADDIRAALSIPPGGPHDYPWRETGALHDSIETDTMPTEAIVGSTSDVALYQEHGTSTIPPRPFLAPIAAADAPIAAQAIGAAVAAAIAPGGVASL